jgi:hexosaminidase
MRIAGVLTLLVVVTACARNPRVQVPSSVAPPPHSLIPAPQSIEMRGAPFTVLPTTSIVVSDERARPIGEYLAGVIGLAAGPEPPRVVVGGGADVPPQSIYLRLAALPSAGEEGYELSVSADGVTIAAAQPAGLFYGMQTFRQLLPPFVDFEAIRFDKSRPVQAPGVHIVDRPRFAWRGAMLDVARHFLTVEEVKRYIDLMVLYKMNRLHLHLSDDQGWRLEIKSRPKLTAIGGKTEVGGGPGGFYTQEQYADLIRYAQDRFVTVVPEIDMPSHINAALASYGELNCDDKPRDLYTGTEVGFSNFCVDKEVTYTFIDDVVREIAAMTPGPYFHVGGDEVKTVTRDQYIRFIERVQGILHAHGKQLVGWDEVGAANLLPDSIVQHWRREGSPAQAVAKGAKVIASIATKAYLDMQYDPKTPIGLHWAAYVSVQDAYAWDPVAVMPGVAEPSILGVEAPIWSETIASIRDVEFLAFPRLACVAEIAWSPREPHVWDEFKVRLGAQAPRWSALGINFYRSPAVPWRDW